jgi:NADPH:quinone reductase-like Zn-dependent oxidoreductase
VQAAGVTRFGAEIRLLELPEPAAPGPGEVLLGVRACGMGNWDEFIRTGGWDTGTGPPMPLGVEAAGVIVAVGSGVHGFQPGDAVTTHSLPAGSWAEKFTALAEHLALVPAGVPMTVAAALPVPALTADQALDAVTVRPNETVLVHGAGGVTGGVLVNLAAHRGARVIATAGQAGRARALGAAHVIDYHEPDWPARVRALTSGGIGVDAAVNAARSGSADAVRAVRDGGRLATITGDLPPAERGIALSDIVVVPDGARLARLVPLLAPDAITMGASYPLAEAAAAMARLREGTHGAAIVLEP